MSKSAEHPPYLTLATEKLAVTLGENLIGMVLYGSHARGEAREESDMDLLVIARNLPERRYDRSVFLQRILRGIRRAAVLAARQNTGGIRAIFPIALSRHRVGWYRAIRP